MKSKKTNLRFADGMEFDLTGPARVDGRQDGLYVVSQGFLCPVEDMNEAIKVIKNLRKNIVNNIN